MNEIKRHIQISCRAISHFPILISQKNQGPYFSVWRDVNYSKLNTTVLSLSRHAPFQNRMEVRADGASSPAGNPNFRGLGQKMAPCPNYVHHNIGCSIIIYEI